MGEGVVAAAVCTSQGRVPVQVGVGKHWDEEGEGVKEGEGDLPCVVVMAVV